MIIKISESGKVSLPAGNVLGYEGEHMLRQHRVFHPNIGNAMFTMMLLYEDGTRKSVTIDDGIMVIDRTHLPAEGIVKAQFNASRNSGSEVRTFRSEIFAVKIMPSVDTES